MELVDRIIALGTQTLSEVSMGLRENRFQKGLVLAFAGLASGMAAFAFNIPGKIEAESYTQMSGVQLEPCSEGTQNVGWTDKGDWMVYPITVPTTGSYTIQYRVSSPNSTGEISADLNAGTKVLGTVKVPNTGSWQNWTTISQTVTLNAGTFNLGIYVKEGGWNLNWINITKESGSAALIPLNSGMQMTVQFANNTRGTYANNQIYAAVVARNKAGQLSHLTPSGNLVPCATSDNGALQYAGVNYANYFYPISDFNGFQFPSFLDSGRMYISMGKPLYIRINQDVNGNVGVAFPDTNNPADPNQDIYFDWIEFAVLNNQIWCNTTQVDLFGLPLTMELFKGSASAYSSFAKVGITESRDSILNAWVNEVPSEFQNLKQSHRIVAPTHGDFKPGSPHGNYFDAYINAIWNQYANSDLVIDLPQGHFTGRVGADSRLRFSRSGDGSAYFVGKPSTTDVFQGSGSLAAGNGIEKALQAQICAAFHRHVMGNAAAWKTPSTYYQAGPADYYAQFWHRHSLRGQAYGFCYDDVNDQSSTMTTPSPRGLIVGIGW